MGRLISRGLNMRDKAKKIIVRILAVILIALMIFGVCAQFVFAAENEKKETTKVTISLEGLTKDFPHTEVLGMVSNTSTFQSKALVFTKNQNFTTTVDLEDGYYFVYSNQYGWKDQGDNVLVINNNLPYNFYVGKSFDSNKYPEQKFEISTNLKVPMNKVGEEISKDLNKIVDKNVVVFWQAKDVIYPLNYVYDNDELYEAMMNSPLIKEGLPDNDLESVATTNNTGSKFPITLSQDEDNDNNDNSENKEKSNVGSETATQSKEPEKQKENNNGVVGKEDSKAQDATELAESEDIKEEDEEKPLSFFGFIWQMFLDTKLLILILIVCAVGLFILKRKNRKTNIRRFV